MEGIVTLYTVSQDAPENYQPFQYYLDYTGDEAVQTAMHYLNIPPNFTCNAYVQKADGTTFWLDMVQTLRMQGLEQGNVIGLQYVVPQQPDFNNQPMQAMNTDFNQQAQAQDQQMQALNTDFNQQMPMQDLQNQDQQQQMLNTDFNQQMPMQGQPMQTLNTDFNQQMPMQGQPMQDQQMQMLNTDFNQQLPLPDQQFYQPADQMMVSQFDYAPMQTSMFESMPYMSSSFDSSIAPFASLEGLQTPFYKTDDFNDAAQFATGAFANFNFSFPTQEPEVVGTTIVAHSLNFEEEIPVIGAVNDEYEFNVNSSVNDFNTSSGWGAASEDGLFDEENSETFVTIPTFFAFKDNFVKVGYRLHDNCQDCLQIALTSIGKEWDEEMALLVTQENGKEPVWFSEGKLLSDFSPSKTTEIHIFDKYNAITVHSQHYKSIKITLDITRPISELVGDIAQALDLDSYHCFTLCSMENPKQPKYMSIEKTILEQTKVFKEVIFMRQYYLFTLEDITTMEQAIYAFEDAKELANKSKLELKKEEILKYAAYNYVATNKGNLSNVPDDISPYLPTRLAEKGKGAGKGESVQKFLDKYGRRLDHFNAIKCFIGLLRHIPGFASQSFDCHISSIVRGQNLNMQVIVEINPYRLLIRDKYGNIEERVSYTELIYINCVDTLEIIFATQSNKSCKYTFESENAEQIYKLISRYRYITNQIYADRGRKFANKGDFQTLIAEKTALYLGATTDLGDQNIKCYKFDRRFTGALLRKACEHYLNVIEDNNHVCLINLIDTFYRWAKDDDILQTYSLQDGMVVYLLDRYKDIRIHYPDDTVRTIRIDVTMTIEELTKDLFKKARLPVLLGYTLWWQDPNKNLIPMDFRLTLPEQVDDYREMYFKRRFYVLSSEVLQTTSSAIQTVIECAKYCNEQGFKIEENDMINYGLYYIYATGSENSHKHKFELADYLPPGNNVSASIQNQFAQVMKESKVMTQLHAAKKYINIVRNLPEFGVEKYKFSWYQDDYRKGNNIKKGYIAIGPKGLYIYDTKGSPVYDRIPLRAIKSYQWGSLYFRLIFIYRNVAVNGLFKIRDTQTIYMLINYNIQLEHDLAILNKEREIETLHEITMKINGGWKDEQGRIHGPMIDLKIGFWGDTKLKYSQWFDLDTPQPRVLETAVAIAGVDQKEEYATLIRIIKGINRWLLPDMVLGDVHPFRDGIIYLHPLKLRIKIYTSDNRGKTIEIITTKTIDELIPMIAEKFRLNFYSGYALLTYKKLRPLDNYKTITEQINSVCDLLFKRFFFIINKAEFEDPDALNQLYLDVKELVLGGKVDMSLKQALELAGMSITAENEKPNPKDVPTDIKPLLPAGMDFHKKSRNEIIDHVNKNSQFSMTEGKIKYINIVRILPTFGVTRHNCTYIQRDEKKVAEIPATIMVGPMRTFVVNDLLKAEAASAEYKHYIKTEYTDTELLIKYSSDKDTSPHHILVRADDPSIIASFILKHIDILNKMLLDKCKDFDPNSDPHMSMERVVLETALGWKAKESDQTQLYDMRSKGSDLLKRAAEKVKLEDDTEYSPLLRLTDDEYRWIGPDDVLGTFFPCDYMLLQIFPTLVNINVHLEGQPSRSVTINITKPLKDLIQDIADRMYVDYYIGYTLYVERPNKSPKPLDLFYSIPEQVGEAHDFLFKRRFFNWTYEDRQQEYVVRSLYPDVRANIMSGVPTLRFTQPQDLAIYSIYASNEEKDPQKIKIPHRDELFPKGTDLNKINMESIKKTIRNNSVIKNVIAIVNYIKVAKNCLGFGSEIFKAQITDDFNIKTPTDVKVSIGPNGIRFYDGKYTKTKPDGTTEQATINEMIGYNYINDYFLMVDHVVIRVAFKNRRIKTIHITSHKAPELYSMLRQYVEIIIQFIKNRTKLQTESEEFKKKAAGKIDFPIKVAVTRRLDHPNPPKFKFGKHFTCEEIIEMSLFYYALPIEIDKWCLLYRNWNMNFDWFRPHQKLQEFTADPKDLIVLLQKTPQITVTNEHGIVHTFNLDITQNIIEQTAVTNEYFKLGSNLGYTFYNILDDNTLHPLNFMLSLPIQTRYYFNLTLRRRFYIFTHEMFEDPVSLLSIYKDTKNFILTGKLVLNVEKAIELAILSLYAEASDQAKVLEKMVKAKPEQIQQLFPPAIVVDYNLKQKFSKSLTVQPPLDKLKAARMYISSTMMMPGYGEEIYDITYMYRNDEIDDFVPKEMIGRISLSPRSILLITSEGYIDGEIFYPFLADWIFTDKKTNTTFRDVFAVNDNTFITFIFSDFSSNNYHVEVHSKDIERIATYISNYLDILDMQNIGTLIDYNQGLNFNRVEVDVDEMDDFDDIDYFQRDFDETNEVDIDIMGFVNETLNTDIDVEIESPTYKLEDEQPTPEINFAEATEDIVDEDLEWRANTDGLQHQRTGRLLDMLEVQLDIPTEQIENLNPNQLFQQLATLNDAINTFVGECDNDDLRDRFLNIRSNIDTLCDTTQSIVLNDQELGPFAEQIHTQLVTALQAIPVARSTSDFVFENFKVTIKDQLEQTPALVKREMPEISKGLIAISNEQELIADTLLKHAAHLKAHNINTFEIQEKLRNTSSTLTRLASTLAEQKDVTMITPHLAPQFIAASAEIAEVQSILDTLKQEGVTIEDLGEAHSKFKHLLAATHAMIKEQTHSTELQKRSTLIVMGNDSNVPDLIKHLDDLPNNKIESLPEDAKVMVNSAYDAIDELKKALSQLNNMRTSEAARLESVAHLHRTSDAINDALMQLTKLPFDGEHQVVQMKLTEIKKLVANQLDVISTRNITPISVAKINDDINYLLNFVDRLSHKRIEQIGEQNMEAINKLKDFQYNMAQQQNALMANTVDQNAVSIAQSLILQLKTDLPQVNATMSRIAELTMDANIPVIMERLDLNIHKAINDPIAEGENLALCDYVLKTQESNYAVANLINELTAISKLPAVTEDPELSVRCAKAIEMSQKTYLDINDVRNDIVQNPFSKSAHDMCRDAIVRNLAAMKEIQVLAHRVADVAQNVKIDQLTDDTIAGYSNVLHALDNAQIDKLPELSGKSKSKPEIVSKVTPEDVQKVLDGLTNLVHVTTYYAGLPEVVSNPDFYNAATNDYNTFYQQYQQVQQMMNNPTPELFDIVKEIKTRANNLHKVAMRIPSYANTPNANQSIPSIVHLLEQMQPEIDNQSQSEVVVSFDDIKKQLNETSPKIKSLRNVLRKLKKADNIKENNAIMEILEDWSKSLRNAGDKLKIHSSENLYTKPLAMSDKESLLVAQRKLVVIPLKVKRVLTPEQSAELEASMSAFNTSALASIALIRNLPRSKKIELNKTKLPRITEDTEIDDFVPMLQDYANRIRFVLDQFQNLPQIQESANSLTLLNQMRKSFEYIDYENLKDVNEEELSEKLVSIHNSIPGIISACELLQPLADSDALTVAFKGFNDLSNSIYKMISGPHMNNAKSQEFVSQVMPQLQQVDAAITKVQSNPAIQSNMLLSNSIRLIQNIVRQKLTELPTLKPRRVQQACDDIYGSICAVLPQIYEINNITELEDSLQTLGYTTETYTALPAQRKAKTESLIIKDELITKQALKTLVELLDSSLTNDINEIGSELYQNITESLSIINDHQNNVPQSIRFAVKDLVPLMARKNNSAVIPSCRLITNVDNSYDNKTEIQTQIAVSATVAAAQSLIKINKAMKYLQDQIRDNARKFGPEVQYYESKALSSLKDSDAKLLVECRTLPAAVLNLENLHNNRSDIALLINALQDNEIVKGIVQPLEESLVVFNNTLHEADNSFASILLNNLERIAYTLDRINIDHPQLTTPQVLDFLHQITPHLKNANRQTNVGRKDLSEICRIYQHFLANVYNNINYKKKKEQKEVRDSVEKLDQFKNVIDLYANPLNFTDKADSLNHLLASLILTSKTFEHVKQEAQQNPEQAATLLAPTSDLLQEVEMTYSIAEKFGYNDQASKEKINKVTNAIAEIIARSHAGIILTIAQALAEISTLLTDLVESVNKQQEIDFNSQDENIVIKDINTELYLTSISDQTCYNLALQSNQLMQGLKDKMKSLKEARANNYQASTNVKDFIKKQATQAALSASSLSVSLNPTLSITSLDPHVIAPAVIQSVQYGPVYAAAVPILQQPKLSSSNTQLMIQQRLEALRQKELSEFPDVVKQLSNKSYTTFTPDQITDSVMSIQGLLSKIDDSQAIEEALSRLTPSQVLVQQHVLKFAIEGITNDTIDAQIVTSDQGLSATKLSLLEATAHKQATSPSVLKLRTVSDINSAIIKDLSLVNLLESLQAISQNMISQTPELCRFVNTPEGQLLFRSPLDAGQIIEAQQQILRQIALCDSQENLSAYTRTFTPSQMINQQRLITQTINMLTSDEVYDIINDSNVGTTPIEILKAANIKVQNKLKESGEENNASLVDIQSLHKSQEFINDLMERVQLAQALMTVQNAHDAATPGLHSNIEKIDVAQPISGQFLEQLCPVLKTQIEYCNSPQQFAEVIAQMQPEDIYSQQSYIAFLAGALTTLPRQELNNIPTVSFQESARNIIERVTNEVSDILYNAPEQLADVDPINDEMNYEEFTKHIQVLNSCITANNMERILSQIRSNSQSIDQKIQSEKLQEVFNESNFGVNEANELRNNLLVLNDLANQSNEELDQHIKSLNDDKMVQSYSVVIANLLRLSNLDSITQKVKAKGAEARVFDRSLLIQAEPQKGIAQHPIAEVLPDVSAINDELLKAYKDLAVATLSTNLTKLTFEYAKSLAKPPQQIQQLLSEQKSVFSLEKISDLQQTMYQQIYSISQQSMYQEIVDKIAQTPETDKAGTESLLVNLSQLFQTQEYLDSCMNDINFIPNDLDDPTVIDQTNQVSAATIAMKLIQIQQQLLQQNMDIISQMPLQNSYVLEKVCSTAKEAQNRANITSKLISLQKELLTKNDNLAKMVEQGRQQGSMKINIAPEELVQLQCEVKSLVSTQATASRIVPLAAGNNQDQLNRLCVISNLVSIVKPEQTVVTPFTNMNEFNSLFADMYNTTTVPVSISSILTNKPKTELMATANAAQTAAGMLPLLAKFSTLPISECSNIFSSSNVEAINIINKLMTPISQMDRDILVQQLADLTPQLVASLSRVSSSITDPDVKSVIIPDPTIILQTVNEIQMNGYDLQDMQKLGRYRQMCSYLLQISKNLDAALVQPQNVNFEFKPVTSCAKIVEALKANDITRLHAEIIDFKALKTASIAMKKDDPIIDAQLANIAEIEEAINSYYISGVGADKKILPALKESQKKTIDLIQSQTPNPFKVIDGLENPAMIEQIFTESRKNLDQSTINLISAVNARDNVKKQDLIAEIIKSVADSQAAMFKGIELASCSSTPVYTDYLHMINSSMGALHSIIEIGKSSAVSSTQIKRATRSFNRMIASLEDMIDEQDLSKQAAPTTKLEQVRFDFIKSLTNSTRNIITTIAASATSKIPESFNSIISVERPRLEAANAELHNAYTNLVAVNTDPTAGNDFSKEFEQLFSVFSEFNKTINTSKAPPLEKVTSHLINIFDNMNHTIVQMDRLTDKDIRVPDMENAEKLPKGFQLPPIPDTTGMTSAQAIPQFEQNVQKYFDAEGKFYKALQDSHVKNSVLVEEIKPLYDCVKEVTQSLLAASVTVLNLEAQRTMTNCASTISDNFDQLINSLRDKFLLKGEFDVVSQKSRQEIRASIALATSTGRSALKKFEEEQRQYAATVAKYTAVINPLQTIKSQFDSLQTSVSSLPASLATELCNSMIKPAQGISQALITILLFSKDHDGAIRNIDNVLALVNQITEQLNQTNESIKNVMNGAEEPETITSQAMRKLSEIAQQFMKDTDTKNNDAKKLIDLVGTFGQACAGIARTSEQALETKKQRAQAATSQTVVRKGGKALVLPKTNLMKRLELESRVIKARIILERSEKKLQAMN